MTFFYDLNKKLSDLADKQTLKEGKGDGNLANNAKPYDKVTRGDVIAGRLGKDAKGGKAKEVDEGIIGTGIGAGLGALALGPLGAVGGAIAGDKVGDAFDEDMGDVVKKIGSGVKKVGQKALDTLGHGSDEDMIRDLQRKAGLPQTGKKPVGEAVGAVNFDKVLDSIAALYGDDIWDNDAMQDLAHDLEQAGPTDQELDFIIAKGRLPKRLANTQFSAGDNVQFGEGSSPMTAKQKSFAALAEPKDKITFADKIAGAKQEVDEMLGDVAAEAMKSAIGKMGAKSHQAKTTMKHVNASNASPKVKAAIGKASKDIKPGTKGYPDRAAALKAAGIKGAPGEVDEDDNNPFTSWKKPRPEKPKVGSIERGALHDIEHTATGRKVTRRVDPNTGHSVGTDDTPAAGDKRGKGRPKGTGKSIGAKGPSGTSKLMTKEGSDSGQAQEIYNELAELRAIAKKAQGGGQMPPGFASRLESSLWAAMTMIKNNQPGNAQVNEKELDEKATSKKQQKFMGMVHAAQKGGKPASKEVGKVAKTMKKKDAEDFAATKHKGLPEKKAKKKEVEETSDSTPSKSGMQYGKGVYEAKLAESFNARMTEVLNESMNINATVDSEGHNSLNVSATDEDAGKLAQILKLAGMGGSSEGYSEVCPSCGSRECGCEQVDEELANSADNTEYAGIDTMTKTLSGGLNGPKTTGQTTTPVLNRDPARGSVGPMAESQEARLWELYQRYSRK